MKIEIIKINYLKKDYKKICQYIYDFQQIIKKNFKESDVCFLESEIYTSLNFENYEIEKEQQMADNLLDSYDHQN